MASQLAHAWADLVAALIELAPVSASTIRPPAPRAVERLEAAVETDLTDEVREWFTLHGGTPPRGAADVGLGARLIPDGYLTSVDEAIEYDAWWRQERLTMFDIDPEVDWGEAGRPAFVWAPQYVLVACDQGDGWTFVDTRPGSMQGRIGQLVKGNGDSSDEPGYPSLAALVDAVTRSIRHGETVDHYWHATISDGKLDWDLIDDELMPIPPDEDVDGSASTHPVRPAPEAEPSAGGGRAPFRLMINGHRQSGAQDRGSRRDQTHGNEGRPDGLSR